MENSGAVGNSVALLDCFNTFMLSLGCETSPKLEGYGRLLIKRAFPKKQSQANHHGTPEKECEDDSLSVIKQTQWMPDSENTTQESLFFFCCLVTWLANRTWWLSKPHRPTVGICEHSWWLGSWYSQNEQRYGSAHDSTVPHRHLRISCLHLTKQICVRGREWYTLMPPSKPRENGQSIAWDFLYVKAWQSAVGSNTLQILPFVQYFPICTYFIFKTG